MLKKLILFSSLFMALQSCNTQSQLEKADNPLDGGRYFIENYMQGDMIKSKHFLLVDTKNQAYFDQLTKDYFALVKESRTQLRQASLQINEVRSLDSNTTVIYYQYSVDTLPRWMKVVNTPDGWKVDLKFSYGPKL